VATAAATSHALYVTLAPRTDAIWAAQLAPTGRHYGDAKGASNLTGANWLPVTTWFLLLCPVVLRYISQQNIPVGIENHNELTKPWPSSTISVCGCASSVWSRRVVRESARRRSAGFCRGFVRHSVQLCERARQAHKTMPLMASMLRRNMTRPKRSMWLLAHSTRKTFFTERSRNCAELWRQLSDMIGSAPAACSNAAGRAIWLRLRQTPRLERARKMVCFAPIFPTTDDDTVVHRPRAAAGTRAPIIPPSCTMCRAVGRAHEGEIDE